MCKNTSWLLWYRVSSRLWRVDLTTVGRSSFLRYDIVTRDIAPLIMLLCLNKHYITKKSNIKKRRHCKLWQYILSWKIIKYGSLRNKRRLYFHSFYRRLFGDVEIYCVDEFTPLYLLISHTQLFMHGCILVYYFLVGSREKMLEFWGRYTAEKTGDKHLSSGIRNQYMTKIISQSFLIFTP